MAAEPTAAIKGLKGVVAADSTICDVDGDLGRLIYRGYNIDELAERSTFEETAFLLLNTDLPTAAQLAAFRDELAAVRSLTPELLNLIERIAKADHPMSALRSAVSMASLYDDLSEDTSVEAFRGRSIRLIAKTATMIAAIHRCSAGLPLVEPRTDLSHAANFMYMLNGEVPSADAERAMDVILITHAEHGLNASTFAARVVAATLTDMYSCVTAAIGALKGPLHGGANTAVLKVLQEVGSVDAIPGYVQKTVDSKGKFMGFGHAVYKVEDPRAKHLKHLSAKLAAEKGDPLWYELSVELERQVVAAIKRQCNVDFYSASLQHYMGIPGNLFTCVFAASRVAGWCAHVIEQVSNNKIIRPDSNYVGASDRAYRPLSQRG